MDTKLRVRLPEPQEPMPLPAFHRWEQPDGALWAEFFRFSAGYRVRFPGLADFTICADGRQVDAFPTPGTDETTVEHLYLNQVMPLVLSHRGELVLHGSAVDVGGEAIAFIGPSGRGKSTLAASFARKGYPFLADDSLQLTWEGESLMVRPSHPSIRLWEDSFAALMSDEKSVSVLPAVSYTTKARLLAGGAIPFRAESRPLRRVYILGLNQTSVPTVRKISRSEALAALVENTFLLDLDERRSLMRHFDFVNRLVSKQIFYMLDYPKDYAMLMDVHNIVLRHLCATNVES